MKSLPTRARPALPHVNYGSAGRDNGPMRITSLGYLTDLAVRRAEGSEIADLGDHVVVRSPGNPGYWWGNFLLLAEAPGPQELARWLKRFEAEFPAARHRTFGLDLTSVSHDAAAVFLAEGFQPERNVVLTARSLDAVGAPRIPAVIRPLAGDDDWRQSARLRRACAAADDQSEVHRPGRAGRAPEPDPQREEFEQRKLAARRRLTEAGMGAWLGAFADGRLVAQLGVVDAGCGLARYQDVETHPGYRRRGLAGALVIRAARTAVTDFGAARLVMLADPGYHAIRLYRSLGFEPAEEQVGFLRPP